MKLNFNFVRVLGVYGVIFYHLNEHFFVQDIFRFGSLGVYLCLALTGFLFAYLHLDEDDDSTVNVNYFVKKIQKFWPLHFISFLVAIVYEVISTLYYKVPVNIELSKIIHILINLLLIQSWIPSSKYYFSYNGASWYLSSTMFFYLICPLFNKLLCKYKRHMFGILVGVTTAILIVFYNHYLFADATDFIVWLTYINPILNCILMVIPMFIGFVCKNISHSKKLLLSFLCVVIAVVMYCTFGIYQLGAVVLTSGLLVFLSIDCKMLNVLFNNRIIKYLSSISLEMYLLHQPLTNIIDFIFRTRNIQMDAFYIFLIDFLVVFVIANLVHFLMKSNKISYQ